MRTLGLVFTFSFFVLSTSVSFAQTPMKTKSAVEWQSIIVPRINPLGLFAASSLSYRLKLYDSELDLLKNNFVRVAAQPWVSPSWFRPGVRLDLQPLSILKLSVSHEFLFHFGTFGILQSFESPTEDYSETRLDLGKEAGENYRPVGQQTTFSVLLQAKVGPVAVRNNAKLALTNFPLRQGDTVFYDQLLDILVQGSGWNFVDDVDLLFLTDFGLIAGLRYTLTQAYYDDDTSTTHRLGPLITYKFLDNPDEVLSEVTGILLANWWLKHPYRTGQETSQAIPYLGVGVKLAGKLY